MSGIGLGGETALLLNMNLGHIAMGVSLAIYSFTVQGYWYTV